jgi:hypothetical protein
MLRRVLWVLILLIASALTCRQQHEPVVKIEFTSFTRGFQKQTFISPDSLIQLTNKRGVISVAKRHLDSLEWQSVIESLQEVQIDQIKDLPAPSSRRTFDGAMHSTITIITGDKKKYEHTFDDEFPHEKLFPLMQVVKKVAGEDTHR